MRLRALLASAAAACGLAGAYPITGAAPGTPATPSLLVDRTWLPPGQTVAGTWTSAHGLTALSGDFVGLYLTTDAPAAKPLWRLTVCTPSPGAPACPSFGVFNTSRATSNSSAWGAPASAPQHNYEFRYVPGVGASAGAPVSRSLPMVYAPTPAVSAAKTSVGPNVPVSGSFSVAGGAFVGLFLQSASSSKASSALWFRSIAPGAATGAFATSDKTSAPAWVTPAAKGDVAPVLKAPIAGPWEFRVVSPTGAVLGVSRPIIYVGYAKCSDHGATRSPAVQHVIHFTTENHAFDSFYGSYCSAPAGSSPACTTGRACCEGLLPAGGPYVDLTDAANAAWDPCHTAACELCEMDGGKMDKYRTGCEVAAPSSSSPLNVAAATYTGKPSDTLSSYYSWAAGGAIADRFYQSTAGQSSSNDMYVSYGRFQFLDNSYQPNSLVGNCPTATSKQNFNNITILDALGYCGVSVGMFPAGYAAAASDIPGNPCYPLGFDATDVGFSYAASIADRPDVYADSQSLVARIQLGTLPSVSYVRSLGTASEHPGVAADSFAQSQAYIGQIVAAVLASPVYAKNTLILIHPDESGGYYDHLPPLQSPAPVDGAAYGPRMPLTAIGYAAAANKVSHTPMEPSSVLAFIEWNWFTNGVGQLGARDGAVNNIGSMLDPKKGPVPSDRQAH